MCLQEEALLTCTGKVSTKGDSSKAQTMSAANLAKLAPLLTSCKLSDLKFRKEKLSKIGLAAELAGSSAT